MNVTYLDIIIDMMPYAMMPSLTSICVKRSNRCIFYHGKHLSVGISLETGSMKLCLVIISDSLHIHSSFGDLSLKQQNVQKFFSALM